MQKKKQIQPTKQIILFIVLAILLLLIIFAEDVIKLTNKNKVGLAEDSETESIQTESNIPVLSAGMIPVKWENGNFVITTKEDKNWYDYKSGKPAYIMLNDGYYQSELIRDMTNKELAEDNVGVGIPDYPNIRGTIFVWIPRFAYNEEGDIQCIEDIESTDENWTIPEMFTYAQTSETAPNFLLTGVWLEKDVDNLYSTKITQMNQEESIYGFIRNTIAVPSDQANQNAIQNYIANTVGTTSVRNTQENLPNVALSTEEYPSNVGVDVPVDPLSNLTNPNRIILKIINQNHQDSIKAKVSYEKEKELITVQVTYSQYGIEKIILENEHELNFTKLNGIIVADTTGIDLESGCNRIIIIDNRGKTKELKVTVILPIYAVLYTDGTLAFGRLENPIPSKIVSVNYGDISGITSGGPWINYRTGIKIVEFVDKISPITTEMWFNGCENLITINNMDNLNTSNVTDMSQMFNNCTSLSEIDLSNFNTSKVTEMDSMFAYCTNLRELDLSSFNTSKVTDMRNMFFVCTSLSEIDLSNFNTSKVTMMDSMFNSCTSLSKVDLSNFDTNKVTRMNSMFSSCTNLNELNLSGFDTSKVTDMRYMFNNCRNLKKIYVNESTSMWSNSIVNSTNKSSPYYNMFTGCGTNTVTRK